MLLTYEYSSHSEHGKKFNMTYIMFEWNPLTFNFRFIAGGNDRFYDRNISNRDSGNNGRKNGSNMDRRTSLSNVRQNNQSRDDHDDTHDSEKSSRWGNVSPTSNASEENWNVSPQKKQSTNERIRSDNDSNEITEAARPNDSQDADSLSNDIRRPDELLNDPTNPVPVRPIRLSKDQKPTEKQSNKELSTDTQCIENVKQSELTSSTEASVSTETLNPEKRTTGQLNTPLYDEVEESRKTTSQTISDYESNNSSLVSTISQPPSITKDNNIAELVTAEIIDDYGT